MTDWESFVDCVPWFLEPSSDVMLKESEAKFSPSEIFRSTFPHLSILLGLGDVTFVTVNNSDYVLYGWDNKLGYRFGWLCELPPTTSIANVCKDHRILFKSFGGIRGIFGEPDETWLLNLNSALISDDSARDASFIEDYHELFEMEGAAIPISLKDYYSLAVEANGNTTLCNKDTGNILLFAPDHCFDHLEVFSGCPEYTLYTYIEARTLREWVENVADQWLKYLNHV